MNAPIPVYSTGVVIVGCIIVFIVNIILIWKR